MRQTANRSIDGGSEYLDKSGHQTPRAAPCQPLSKNGEYRCLESVPYSGHPKSRTLFDQHPEF